MPIIQFPLPKMQKSNFPSHKTLYHFSKPYSFFARPLDTSALCSSTLLLMKKALSKNLRTSSIRLFFVSFLVLWFLWSLQGRLGTYMIGAEM